MAGVCYYCGTRIQESFNIMPHLHSHIDSKTRGISYSGSFMCVYKNCKQTFSTYGSMHDHARSHLKTKRNHFSRKLVFIGSKKLDDCITGMILMKNGIDSSKRYSFYPNRFSNDIVAAATIIHRLKK